MNLGDILDPLDLGDQLKGQWHDVKDSFSSKNSKDPVARVGAAFSIDPLTRGIADKITGGDWSEKWDSMQTRVPDHVNLQGAKYLNGLADQLNGPEDHNAQGHGADDWMLNKPATTLASLITGYMFGAGALGSEAAGEAGVGADAGAGEAGAGEAGGWQQYLDYAQNFMGSGGGAQQPQEQPPPQAPRQQIQTFDEPMGNLGEYRRPEVHTNLAATLPAYMSAPEV